MARDAKFEKLKELERLMGKDVLSDRDRAEIIQLLKELEGFDELPGPLQDVLAHLSHSMARDDKE